MKSRIRQYLVNARSLTLSFTKKDPFLLIPLCRQLHAISFHNHDDNDFSDAHDLTRLIDLNRQSLTSLVFGENDGTFTASDCDISLRHAITRCPKLTKFTAPWSLWVISGRLQELTILSENSDEESSDNIIQSIDLSQFNPISIIVTTPGIFLQSSNYPIYLTTFTTFPPAQTRIRNS